MLDADYQIWRLTFESGDWLLTLEIDYWIFDSVTQTENKFTSEIFLKITNLEWLIEFREKQWFDYKFRA